MSVTLGTTPWTKAEDNARQALADCDAFKLLVKASDATEAKESIYIDDIPDPEDEDSYSPDEILALFPLAVVSSSADDGFVLQPTATSHYSASGAISIGITRVIAENDDSSSFRAFKDIIGNIAEDLSDGSEVAGHLVHPTIQIADIWRSKPDKKTAVGFPTMNGLIVLQWGHGTGED